MFECYNTIMSSKFQNFLSFVQYSVSQPLKLLILGSGLLTTAIAPDSWWLTIPSSLIATALLVFQDLGNRELIDSFITEQNQSNNSKSPVSKNLSNLIAELKRIEPNYTDTTLKSRVKEVISAFMRIEAARKKLTADDYSSVSFIDEYVVKLYERFVDLAKKYQYGVDFLNEEADDKARTDLEELLQKRDSTRDRLAKESYAKAVNLIRKQLADRSKLRKKLERIDSYIVNIISALEKTSSDLTKIKLKESDFRLDDAEILTESLNEIIKDLDRFEESYVEIESSEGNGEKTKKVPTTS